MAAWAQDASLFEEVPDGHDHRDKRRGDEIAGRQRRQRRQGNELVDDRVGIVAK